MVTEARAGALVRIRPRGSYHALDGRIADDGARRHVHHSDNCEAMLAALRGQVRTGVGVETLGSAKVEQIGSRIDGSEAEVYG